MAVTFDREFFEFFTSRDSLNRDDISKVIEKCVKIKADVVSKDEKEAGIRAVLNYGHTFAHVIENETNYSKFLHGEAVAIGINMANSLAFKLGLISKDELDLVAKTLAKFDLPISYRISNIDKFYDKFYLDKKSINSKLKFILPKGIGSFAIRDDIEKETILEVLREFK